MSKYKNVPIKAAKSIATEYNKNQVIVVCWDNEHKQTHVTTYGRTGEECDQAAQGGNRVKRALGWPESLCGDEPSRVTKLKKEINRLKQDNTRYREAIKGAIEELQDARSDHHIFPCPIPLVTALGLLKVVNKSDNGGSG